jgi:hypothetical protein
LSKTPNINNLRSSGKQPTFTLDTEFDNIKYVLRSVAVYRITVETQNRAQQFYPSDCIKSEMMLEAK